MAFVFRTFTDTLKLGSALVYSSIDGLAMLMWDEADNT